MIRRLLTHVRECKELTLTVVTNRAERGGRTLSIEEHNYEVQYTGEPV